MLTWKRGRSLVFQNLQKHAIPLEDFLSSLFVAPPTRVYGTAIFLRGESDGVPHALLHNLSHNKVLHERVVFFTVHVVEEPWVPADDQVKITELGHQCYQLNVHYGFKDEPDIPKALAQCERLGMTFDMMETSFFIARQTVISTPGSGMATWREHLFVAMSRNARGAADYYQIPTNRVIELGTQPAYKVTETLVGTGTVAAAGDLVTTHRVGYLYDSTKADFKGAKVESTVDSGKPAAPFTLGVGNVPTGWDQTIIGMK
eukprot:gene24391-24467_t